MALILPQTDTDLQGASECGVIAACATGTIAATTLETLLVAGGTLGTVEQTADIPAASSRLVMFQQSEDGVPGVATWDAGDWIFRFNITTAQGNLTLAGIWICRVNLACSVVATIVSETGIGLDISTGGVFSRTLNAAEHTGTASDRIYIVTEIANSHSHTARTVGITPSENIDTPIIVAAPPSVTEFVGAIPI